MSEGFSEQDPSPKQTYHHYGENDPKGKSHSGSSIGQYFLPAVLIAGLVFLLRIAATSTISGKVVTLPGERLLETVVGYAVVANEFFATLVIAVASVQGLLQYLRTNFRRKPLNHQISDTESIRLQMGHKLSLALEFAVAADILRLAISPSTYYLIVLFAIILLLVLLNYFLEHDGHTIRESRYVQELEDAASVSLPYKSSEGNDL